MTDIELREGLALGEIVIVSADSLEKLESRVLAAEARLKELESGGRQEWRVRSDSYTWDAPKYPSLTLHALQCLARRDHTNIQEVIR